MSTASQKLKTLRRTAKLVGQKLLSDRLRARRWSEQQHPRYPKGHPLGGQFANAPGTEGGSHNTSKNLLFKLKASEKVGFKKLITDGKAAISPEILKKLDDSINIDNLPKIKRMEVNSEKYAAAIDDLMQQTLEPEMPERDRQVIFTKMEKLADKYHDANSKIFDLKQEIRDNAADAMAELRRDLQEKAEALMSYEEAEALSAKVIINDRSSKIMSKSAVIGAIANFFQLTNGKASRTLNAIDYVDDRAHVTSLGGMVNIGKERPIKSFNQMMYHELGHLAELEDSTISDATTNWLKSRAMGKPEPLSAMIPGSLYDDDEVAYPDSFVSPYVGKVYEGGATEVVSMGMQHFAYREDMLELYEKDKEHFFLTLGIILRNQD